MGLSDIRFNGESELEQGISNQGATKLVASTTKATKFHVKPEISLEHKVYPETYYHHNQANIVVDETPTKFRLQNLPITNWILIEKQQLIKLNLST